ncbi:MAG: tetratricopeptide repeat protein [Planctomycetota bacterium]
MSSAPRFPLALVLAALAVVALAFARSLQGELVYDDLLLIARNPALADLGELRSVFGRSYWDFLAPGDAQSIGYWRPLPAAAHLLAWRLSGESVLALHAVSLAAHLVASLAAGLLAWSLVRDRMVTVATVALFGLHPLHVESVAWISALNDPLFGAFALLALASFARWRAAGSRCIALAAAVWFSLALASKEMGAAVLPLAVVIDLARPRRDDEGAAFGDTVQHRAARAYGPLLAVLALYFAARMFVFESPWAGFDRVTTDFGVGWSRLALLRVELLGRGTELLALPLELRLFRPFRPDLTWWDPAALRALAGVAFLAALVFVGLRTRRRGGLSAGLLIGGWVVASLLPILIRVESLGRFPLSDRFLYLSVFAAAFGLALLARSLLARRPALVTLGALALVWAWRSDARSAVWQDERTLFETEAALSPRSVYVQWGLGRVLLAEYQRTDDPALLERAIDVYEHAQQLLVDAKQPGSDLFVSSRDNLQVRLGYGWAQLFLARSQGFAGSKVASFFFEELAQDIAVLRSGEASARELGIRVRSEHLEVEQVHNALGVSYLFEGRLDEARAALSAALAANPTMPEAHQNLGRLAAAEGDARRALAHFRRAAELRPGHLEDALLVAQTRFELGNLEAAKAAAERLAAKHGDSAPVELLLAAIALHESDTTEALSRIDRTLALDPRNAQAFYLRGNALVVRQRTEDAIEAFRRATELDPNHFEAHHDLAALLLAEGAEEAARGPLLKAFSLARTTERATALRTVLAQYEWRDPRVLFELAAIEGSREELDAAETWIDLGLALAPDDPDLLYQRGRIQRHRGRDDEALASMRASLERVDGFVARSELGHYLEELGRFDEAASQYERALELAPPADWPREKAEGAVEGVELRLRKLAEREAAR